MTILATMPGRHGDILWSLATVRALAEAYDTPVGFVVSPKYGGLAQLIRQQPYIDFCNVDPYWEIEESAPITPRVPQRPIVGKDCAPFDRVYHIAYSGWPEQPLPYECARIANITRATYREPAITIDLARPWISAAPWTQMPHEILVGFSDEWFELKFGLLQLVVNNLRLAETGFLLCAVGSRWATEGPFEGVDWTESAQRIAAGQVFLGCCSALHVLAVAMGKRCVIVEPNPQRHHDIFWPLGKTGRVQLVLGGDGLPTFDARHCRDALQAMLTATESEAV